MLSFSLSNNIQTHSTDCQPRVDSTHLTSQTEKLCQLNTSAKRQSKRHSCYVQGAAPCMLIIHQVFLFLSELSKLSSRFLDAKPSLVVALLVPQSVRQSLIG